MLTIQELEDLCEVVANSPAYFDELGTYKRQALQHYVKGKRAELAHLSEDAQAYHRMIAAYNLTDVEAAILATPAIAPAATVIPTVDASKLSLRQVALLYIYTGQQIPNSEANTIAQAHGHTSGEKLYKHYNSLAQIEDRTHIGGRAVKPLIKDVQAILPQLSGQQRKYAESELKTLKSKIIDQS